MERVYLAVARHPAAGIGLALAVLWLGVVARECYGVHPWNMGDWYAKTAETTDLAWRGVAGVAALVWLFERATA